MSHEPQDESQEVQQALGQDSILQLTKQLAEVINRKGHGSGKASHLKIYEALLCKRLSKDMDPTEMLSKCIESAGGDEATNKRLLSLIGQLGRLDAGREVVHFLSLLGHRPNTWDNKEPPSPGPFSCPRQMLDGSVFRRPPNDSGPGQFYRSGFDFKAPPGANLPLCSNFLGSPVPVVGQQTPLDLGYSSSGEDSELDWETAARLGPPPPRRTWEQLGRVDPDLERPLLTDGLPRQRADRAEFAAHLGYLLLGVQSDSFPYSEEMKSFLLAKDLHVAGISPKALVDVVKPLLACGTSHFHLSNFSNANDRSKIIQAIQRAVRNLLLLYRRSVQGLVPGHGEQLLGVLDAVHSLGAPLVAASAFCVPPGGKRLRGLQALEQLSQICSQLEPGRTASVFCSLLRAAAEAYLRMLWAWIFDGALPDDKKSEFFIQSQMTALVRRDRTFFADSYVVLDNKVPSFLRGLEADIKQCGIAVSFLKTYKKNHRLLSLRDRPPVACCLGDAELERLQQQCVAYEQQALEVCGPTVTMSEQLEINQEEQQAFLAMVAQVREQRLQEIRAAQKEERERKAEISRRLKQELAQQIEECRARKAEQLRQEKEEELKFEQELAQLQERQLQLLEEEKERIRHYYEDLKRAPEERLASTEAEIRQLREELGETDNPRAQPEQSPVEPDTPMEQSIEAGSGFVEEPPVEVQIITEEASRPAQAESTEDEVDNRSPLADVNRNPVMLESRRDDNANVGHRHPPDSLSLILAEPNTEMFPTRETPTLDNRAISEMFQQRAEEAARNKARVMQHEFFYQQKQADGTGVDQTDAGDSKLDDVASPVEEATTPVGLEHEEDGSACVDTPDTVPMSLGSDDSPKQEGFRLPPSASSYSVVSMQSSGAASDMPARLDSTAECRSMRSLVRLTATTALQVQRRLANQHVLHVFLHELGLLGHLNSLRRFFLLLDGEFAARLTQLGAGVSASAGALNLILGEALAACADDPNKRRLSLAPRAGPAGAVAEAAGLSTLQMQYDAGWPLNCILTVPVLRGYDDLFSFLLGLRRTVWVLDETFRQLKTGVACNRKALNSSSQHRTLSLQLFEMSAFFRAFHSYVVNVAVVQQWPKCEDALKKVTTLDQLYHVHTRNFLKTCLYRCLLRKEANQIQLLLAATVRPVLRFHALLVARSWTLQDGQYVHPQFKSLCLEYRKYHERTTLLAKNLSKLASRGYQSDLQDLCDYLRMNDYYSVLNVDPTPSMASSASSLKSR